MGNESPRKTVKLFNRVQQNKARNVHGSKKIPLICEQTWIHKFQMNSSHRNCVSLHSSSPQGLLFIFSMTPSNSPPSGPRSYICFSTFVGRAWKPAVWSRELHSWSPFSRSQERWLCIARVSCLEGISCLWPSSSPSTEGSFPSAVLCLFGGVLVAVRLCPPAATGSTLSDWINRSSAHRLLVEELCTSLLCSPEYQRWGDSTLLNHLASNKIPSYTTALASDKCRVNVCSYCSCPTLVASMHCDLCSFIFKAF